MREMIWTGRMTQRPTAAGVKYLVESGLTEEDARHARRTSDLRILKTTTRGKVKYQAQQRDVATPWGADSEARVSNQYHLEDELGKAVHCMLTHVRKDGGHWVLVASAEMPLVRELRALQFRAQWDEGVETQRRLHQDALQEDAVRTILVSLRDAGVEGEVERFNLVRLAVHGFDTWRLDMWARSQGHGLVVNAVLDQEMKVEEAEEDENE